MWEENEGRQRAEEDARRRATRASVKEGSGAADDIAIPDYVMLDFGLPNPRRRAPETPHGDEDFVRGRE